ncbi:hypothetical protein GCM10010207_63930 [Streptomyces atratus]|nr:hypothetical protein GCM10010207_63930 [Streptomyces atratus]
MLTTLRHDDTQAQPWSAQTLPRTNEAKTTCTRSCPRQSRTVSTGSSTTPGAAGSTGSAKTSLPQANNDLLGKAA